MLRFFFVDAQQPKSHADALTQELNRVKLSASSNQETTYGRN